jgi:hypothetical protein
MRWVCSWNGAGESRDMRAECEGHLKIVSPQAIKSTPQVSRRVEPMK